MKVSLSIEDVTPEDLANIAKFLDEQEITCGPGPEGSVQQETPHGWAGGKADGATTPPDSSIPNGVQTDPGQTAPPPPPASEEQESTASPSTASNTTTELDEDNLPWDERIHAGSRVKNKDGRWRKRKNIKKEFVDTVEAELRAAGWGKEEPNAGTSEPAGQTPPPPPASGQQNAAPPPPPANSGGNEPPAPPAKVPSFAEAMPIISERLQNGDLTNATVEQAFAQVGVESFPQVCRLDAENWERFVRITLPDQV